MPEGRYDKHHDGFVLNQSIFPNSSCFNDFSCLRDSDGKEGGGGKRGGRSDSLRDTER